MDILDQGIDKDIIRKLDKQNKTLRLILTSVFTLVDIGLVLYILK